jgi:hypothetical protein
MIGPRPSALRPLRDGVPPAVLQTYRLEGAVAPAAVDLPILSDEVWRIASKGFPLWERIADMQLRNRRITLAYGDLSCRLADMLAAGGPRQANWCTFATWSSKTIGNWIEEDDEHEPLPRPWWMPPPVARGLDRLTRWLVIRDNGATYRSLVAGNRFVFLEIGLAVTSFLETFAVLAPTPEGREAQWDGYWDCVEALLEDLAELDPSWMLTETPPPADLRLGMRKYFEAMTCADPADRPLLVFAGNVLMAAYEQRRVDGYVRVSLALQTGPAMRKLIRRRFDPDRAWYRRVPATLWARLMTRFLVLEAPDEELHVCRPLPSPPGGGPMFPPDLTTITDPLVQALLTRYDESDGRAEGRRVEDWTSYDERMNYITNLFRSRQQHAPLFTDPFPPDVVAALLEGKLPPHPTRAIPPGELVC